MKQCLTEIITYNINYRWIKPKKSNNNNNYNFNSKIVIIFNFLKFFLYIFNCLNKLKIKLNFCFKNYALNYIELRR